MDGGLWRMGRSRFVPDDRCLGGAHQIEAEYLNMKRKICEASAQVGRENCAGQWSE